MFLFIVIFLDPVCAQHEDANIFVEAFSDDAGDFVGVARGDDEDLIDRMDDGVIRGHDRDVGGRREATLLERGGVDDVLYSSAELRGGGEGEALVARTPDGHGPMTLREVVDVCIDRSRETVVAVAQGGHVDEAAAVMELAELVRVGLPHDGLDRVTVHEVHAEELEAAVLQELLERELGVVRDVVAEQLVVAVVAEDVLEARDGDEAEGLWLQVVPYVPEHVARIRLMLEEVELHEGVERALRVAHVAGREALVDAILFIGRGIGLRNERRLMLDADKVERGGVRLTGQRVTLLIAGERSGTFRVLGEILPHAKELTAATADFHDTATADVLLLHGGEEARVLLVAEARHGAGATAGADDVTVIVDRLSVELDEAAGRALAEREAQRMVLRELRRRRDVLRTRRHVIEGHQRRQRVAAGDTGHLHI